MNNNISQLNPEFNYILSAEQFIGMRYALRVLLFNLRTKDNNLEFVPPFEDREDIINDLQNLLNDTDFNKVRLSNFITNS